MTHGHAHEEAEHASHHAADPFDRRVAMTMVMLAALLAAVKVLGHRTHNETLAYQIKAGVAQTEESNLRNFFQAKRQRTELARLQATQLELIAPLRFKEEGSTPAASDEPLPKKDEALASIENELKGESVEAPEKEAEKIVSAGEKRYRELRKAGYPPNRVSQIVKLEMDASRYRVEGAAINKRAQERSDLAKKYKEKSEHKHHQANYFDLGELGVELGLVLCSVAILTKRSPYWLAGIATAALGIAVMSIGFFV